MKAIVFDFATRRIIPQEEGAEMFLCVKNWEKFQCYKDGRDLQWIKLHLRLLNDYEFSQLPDRTKAHLMLIWLLAAQTDNKIPDDPEWIAQKIGANSQVDLHALVQAGFLVERTDTPSVSVRNTDEVRTKRRVREEKSEKREDKSESVRAHSSLALAHAESDPVEMWRETFQAEPPIYVQEVIAAQIEDLTAWQMALDFWAQHPNWSPNNLTGLINNYRKCCAWRAQITVGASQAQATSPDAEEYNVDAEIVKWIEEYPDPTTRPDWLREFFEAAEAKQEAA